VSLYERLSKEGGQGWEAVYWYHTSGWSNNMPASPRSYGSRASQLVHCWHLRSTRCKYTEQLLSRGMRGLGTMGAGTMWALKLKEQSWSFSGRMS